MSELRQQPPKKKKKQRTRRMPNGVGSVHQINDGKNRRNPWRARVPVGVHFDPTTQKATYKYLTLGYFATENDAIDALYAYRRDPYTVEAANVTFADIYEMWSKQKFKEITLSSRSNYTAAYKKCTSLHDMKMRDIRSSHLEKVMQDVNVGAGSQKIIKVLWSQLFNYAIKHDIIKTNYAKFVDTRDKLEESNRTAIPVEDRNKIWQAIDDGNPIASIVMIYIYTGFRAKELLAVKKEGIDLEKRIIIGGLKTEAGKDRHVPIHPCILDLIKTLMQDPGDHLIMEDIKGKRRPIPYGRWNKVYWRQFINDVGLNECYTTHYTRHTCATMMAEAQVPFDVRQTILGHSKKGNVTATYTHYSDEALVTAMDKVPGRPL